ncbi:hypothetical protein BJ742DRAFT_871836 [Cladochytrium replicatum]|nr:hypothetical protein BJ742DRAFT_871836 [Cladochytrium replicatum]
MRFHKPINSRAMGQETSSLQRANDVFAFGYFCGDFKDKGVVELFDKLTSNDMRVTQFRHTEFGQDSLTREVDSEINFKNGISLEELTLVSASSEIERHHSDISSIKKKVATYKLCEVTLTPSGGLPSRTSHAFAQEERRLFDSLNSDGNVSLKLDAIAHFHHNVGTHYVSRVVMGGYARQSEIKTKSFRIFQVAGSGFLREATAKMEAQRNRYNSFVQNTLTYEFHGGDTLAKSFDDWQDSFKERDSLIKSVPVKLSYRPVVNLLNENTRILYHQFCQTRIVAHLVKSKEELQQWLQKQLWRSPPPSPAKVIRIGVVGNVGYGKSSLLKRFGRVLDQDWASQIEVAEGDDRSTHTLNRASYTYKYGGYEVEFCDFPGLTDVSGGTFNEKKREWRKLRRDLVVLQGQQQGILTDAADTEVKWSKLSEFWQRYFAKAKAEPIDGFWFLVKIILGSENPVGTDPKRKIDDWAKKVLEQRRLLRVGIDSRISIVLIFTHADALDTYVHECKNTAYATRYKELMLAKCREMGIPVSSKDPDGFLTDEWYAEYAGGFAQAISRVFFDLKV